MRPLVVVKFGLEKTMAANSKQARRNIRRVESALNGSYVYKVRKSFL